MLPLYAHVRLTVGEYESEGAKKGMVGYIIEVYPEEMYEVEFSDPATGATVAQIVARDSDLELVDEQREI